MKQGEEWTADDRRRDLMQQLNGWKLSENASDDARRMVWLMRKAADEIEQLMEERDAAEARNG